MEKKILYHGSNVVIEKPKFGQGNTYNDYGKGFYCTEEVELAKEWACTDQNSGFANKYSLDISSLKILNLSDEKYSILHWLAILINNRSFRINNQLASQAKEYLLNYFLLDISEYDVIIGYRADDSYFSFAMDFLNNVISLSQLERAMYLGKLGEQFVLKSQKSFALLEYVNSEIAKGEIYYLKRATRDELARESYFANEKETNRASADLFMIDILRGEMMPDDSRLQRKVFK